MNYILIFMVFVLVLFSASFCFILYKLKKKNEVLSSELKEYIEALENGHKAIELALKYEDFFNSTVGDIGEIVDTLKAVVGKRQMLSDDPDVQNLIRILAIAHDTLLGYVNAREPPEQRTDQTAGK